MGEGLRMGNTCTPVADSCQCMAKPIQYCKVISFQLKLKKKNKSKKIPLKCYTEGKRKNEKVRRGEKRCQAGGWHEPSTGGEFGTSMDDWGKSEVLCPGQL